MLFLRRIHWKFFIGIFLVLCLACFIIPWTMPIEKMELGAYNAYTESIIQDGDFNIINQLPERVAWLSSSTHNAPDNRSFGIAAFWYPFFLYAKLVDKISPEFSFMGYSSSDTAQLISSCFFSFLLLLFSFKANSLFSNTKSSLLATVFSFLGLCLLYYFLAIPTNNDIPTALIGSILLLTILKLLPKGLRPLHYAFFGLICSLAFTIKVTGIFLLFFVGLMLLVDALKFRYNPLKKSLALVLGFLPLVYLHYLNSYLKYGLLFEPRILARKIMTGGSIAIPLLFQKGGYFYSSPLLALLILYALFLLWKKAKTQAQVLLWAIALYIPLTVFVLSFRFFRSEMFGPRYMIFNFAFFSLLLVSLIEKPLAQKWKTLLFSILALFALWTGYISTENLSFSIWTSDFFPSSCFFKEAKLFIFFLPLLLVISLIVERLYASREGILKGLWILVAFLALSYSGMSVLNLSKNQKNAAKLESQGFFKDKVIAQGPALFFYDDFMSSANIEIQEARENQNPKRIEEMKRLKAIYLDVVSKEKTIDPKGILSSATEEKESFWNDEAFLESQSPRKAQEKLRSSCPKP